MRLGRERLVPLAAFLALALTGVLVLALLDDAGTNGRRALEDALQNEVAAIARSQDARVAGQLASSSSLLSSDWTFEVGSPEDRASFDTLIDILRGLRTGFFLVDLDGVITQGVFLDDPDRIGSRFERPGAEEALASGRPAVLPVSEGITTGLPTTALMVPVRPPGEGGRPGELRGYFVIESEVAVDTDLNRVISELEQGDGGEYLLFDVNGRILAATDPSLVAGTVSDQRLLERPPGLHHLDDDIVVIAGIDAADWRLTFAEDEEQFQEALTGPLQRVGRLVVGVFLVIGALTFYALARRLRTARQEQDRLRQLNETQEEFISIVSHELRTPVAGVVGFLQTTIDHWEAMDEAERLSAVRRAASNARRLQGLTRDVLDSESVTAGRMGYAMNPADLREEVEAAVEVVRTLSPGRTVDFRAEVERAPVVVDADRIQQVLTNLLDNATKISPPDQPIEVRLWRDGDRVRVSVRDHGPGLPADLRERVFDKFVRGQSSTVSGTGLGLYIAREIADAHQGALSVDSTPGTGATFTLDLPLSAVPAEQ